MNIEAHQLLPKYDVEFAGGQFNTYIFERIGKNILSHANFIRTFNNWRYNL